MGDEKRLEDLVIGDRFWLGLAQEMVKAAASAPDRRAEQLSSAIAWFWTVYSAAVLVVFAPRASDFSPIAAVLLALPTVVLIVAYYVASRVRVPIQVEFDPRVPREIEAAHRAAVLQKNRRLAWAEALTALAAVCAVVAVAVVAFMAAPAKTELHGSVGHDSNVLSLLGTFPREAAVRLNIQALKPSANLAPEIVKLYRPSSDGELRAAITVPAADSYRVSAAWKEGNVEKSLSIQVKRGE